MLATTGWTAIRSQREATELQASLDAWRDGSVAGRRLPDPQSEPARLARFFAGPNDAQRALLARRYPLAVGNVTGAPLEPRYRANRHALRQAPPVDLTTSGRRD